MGYGIVLGVVRQKNVGVCYTVHACTTKWCNNRDNELQ
jgi:hypothetical protein